MVSFIENSNISQCTFFCTYLLYDEISELVLLVMKRFHTVNYHYHIWCCRVVLSASPRLERGKQKQCSSCPRPCTPSCRECKSEMNTCTIRTLFSYDVCISRFFKECYYYNKDRAAYYFNIISRCWSRIVGAQLHEGYVPPHLLPQRSLPLLPP